MATPLNLTAIRQALANQITAGTGRQVRGYPYPTAGNWELPCVVVRRVGGDGTNYHVDMGDECDTTLTVEVMAPCRTTLEDGLRVLDELLSSATGQPTSVIDAIEADRTLGGLVEQLVIGTAGDELGFNDANGELVAAITSIPVEVWVNRS